MRQTHIKSKVLSIALAFLIAVTMTPCWAIMTADEASADGYVAQIDGKNYETLEDAVKEAQDGDTILILPGIIDSNCYVDRNINLTFEGTIGEGGELLTTLNVKQDPKYNGNGCFSLTDANFGKTITIKNINFTNTNSVNGGQAVTVGNQDKGENNLVIVQNCTGTSDLKHFINLNKGFDGRIENCNITLRDKDYFVELDYKPDKLEVIGNTFNEVSNSTLIGSYPTDAVRQSNTVYVSDIIDSTETPDAYANDDYLAKLLPRLGDTDKLVIKEGQDINVALRRDRGDITTAIESVGILNISIKEGTTGTDVVRSKLSTSGSGTISITGGTYAYDPSNYGENHINYVAQGFEAVNNGDGTWTVQEKADVTYVAAIGADQYETLAEAINAVPADNTEKVITMIADTKENVTIPANKKIVLDLNGKTVDGNRTGSVIAVAQNGELTLKDSSATNEEKTNGTGKVTNGYVSAGAGVNVSGGIFNFESGIITKNEASGNSSYSGAGVLVTDGGSFTMTGGVVSENNGSKHGAGIALSDSGTNGCIKGGLIDSNKTTNNAYKGGGIAVLANASLTVQGGTISNNEATQQGGGISVTGGSSKLEIKGGFITNNKAANNGGGICVNAGTTNISGGTIEGNVSQAGGGNIAMAESANLNITGGTIGLGTASTQHSGSLYVHPYAMKDLTISNNPVFKDEVNIAIWNKKSNGDDVTGTAKITGGKFQKGIYNVDRTGFISGGIYTNAAKEATNESLIEPGKGFVENTDETTKTEYPWMIGVAKTYVAQIGDVKYETLQEAFAAATGGTADNPVVIEVLVSELTGPTVAAGDDKTANKDAAKRIVCTTNKEWYKIERTNSNTWAKIPDYIVLKPAENVECTVKGTLELNGAQHLTIEGFNFDIASAGIDYKVFNNKDTYIYGDDYKDSACIIDNVTISQSAAAYITIRNCNFAGEVNCDYCYIVGLDEQGLSGNRGLDWTIDGCTFDATSNYPGMYAYLYLHYVNGTSGGGCVIKNNTFNGTFDQAISATGSYGKYVITDNILYGNYAQGFWLGTGGTSPDFNTGTYTIKNNNFNWQEGSNKFLDDLGFAQTAKDSSVNGVSFYTDEDGFTNDQFNPAVGLSVAANNTGISSMPISEKSHIWRFVRNKKAAVLSDDAAPVAYATLNEALTEAKTGETVQLVMSTPSGTTEDFELPAGITFFVPTGVNYTGTISVPEGKKLVETDVENGKEYTAEDITYVAQIGTTKYSTLEAAVAAAESDDTVELLQTVTLSNEIKIDNSRNITINLNGKNVTAATGKAAFFIDGTSSTGNILTITGIGNIIGNGGSPNKVIYLKGAAGDTNVTTAKLVVDENVTVQAPNKGYAVMISANSNAAYGTEIDIKGTVNGAYGAVYVNGKVSKQSGNVPEINVRNTAKLLNTSDDGAAVYSAGYAKWVFEDGCEVTGPTAVYMKAGNMMNISGGTFESTANKKDCTYNSNGFEATGDCIVIENCGYPGGAPEISITGGKFKSAYADAIASYAKTGYEPITNFISGGHFSSQPAATYIADGKKVIADSETYKTQGYNWTISFNNIITVTSGLQGKESTTVAPVSGGGNYETGETAILSAPEVENLDFVGWFEVGTGSTGPLTGDYNCEIIVSGSKNYIAIYRPKESTEKVNIKVDTKFRTGTSGQTPSGTVTIEGVEGKQETDVNVGESVILVATPDTSTNTKFICWQNNSGAFVSTETSYTTTALESKTLTALFSTENAAIANFKDENGNLLSAGLYFESEVEKLQKVLAPSKKGFQFDGWAGENGNVLSDNDVKEKVKNAYTYEGVGRVDVQAVYHAIATYTVTVQMIDRSDGSTSKLMGDPIVVTENVGTPVIITVDAQTTDSVLTFQGYSESINGENIFCTTRSLTVNPDENVTYYAIYSNNTEVTPKATLITSQPYAEYSNVEKIGFTMTWTLPEECKLVEAGFQYGLTVDIAKAGTYKSKSDLRTSSGSFTMHAIRNTALDTETVKKAYQDVYAQAYIIYKNAQGEECKIYNGKIGIVSEENMTSVPDKCIFDNYASLIINGHYDITATNDPNFSKYN